MKFFLLHLCNFFLQVIVEQCFRYNVFEQCFYLYDLLMNFINDIVIVSLFLTLNKFHTLFWCFYCWICISKCRLSRALRYSAALSNAIQPVYLVRSNTLVNREHLQKIFKSHTISIEIIPTMWLHTIESPAELVIKTLRSPKW